MRTKCLFIIVTILTILITSVYAQNKPNTEQRFTINGHIGLTDTTLKLFTGYRNRGFQTSSAVLHSDGSFTIKGIAGYPQKSILYISGRNNSGSLEGLDQIPFYIENGIITINSKDSLKDAIIGGTPLNNDQQSFLSKSHGLPFALNTLKQKYLSTRDTVKQKNILDAFDEKNDSLKLIVKSFIKENPNSLVSLHLLRQNFDPHDDVDLATNLFSILSDSIQNIPSGQNYKETIENVNKLAVGKNAPDFEAKNINGKTTHLSDYKGKYVLLDFWASWCGPCRKESKNLVDNYKEFNNKNFEIVSFSIDKSGSDWRKAVKEDNYNWTNLIDNDNPEKSISNLYGVDAVPTNYLLNPKGEIIAMNLRGKELKDELTKLLN